MKKGILAVLAGLLIFSLVLSGCTSAAQANTDSGKVINTEKNKEFSIALGANATTGYKWQPKFDSGSITLVDDEYKENDNTGKQIVGAGGTQYFKFKAVKSGETKIEFTYYRPWETPAETDQRQVFTVNVK